MKLWILFNWWSVIKRKTLSLKSWLVFGEMSGTSGLFQLWQVPSSSLFSGCSKLSKDLYLVPARVMYPMSCFRKQMQTTYEIVKGSYVSNPQDRQENKEKLTPKVENVGAFQKLPMVMPSVDILHSALRKAKRVSPTKGIANAAKRERNKGAKQLDSLMKELAVPLRTYKENFPNKKYLHPYERSLIELTLGDGNYEDVLGKLEALRKKVVSVGKEHASICAKICNYPFTTRGILMGHINLSYQNFQVTDTPGILRRCDEDRNNLEKLTLAVLTHLPTAVLYVHDLSGECGMSPSDQFVLYKEMRERFSSHIWLDVVSKCDLLQASPVIFTTDDCNADNFELVRYRKIGPDGALNVSVKKEIGLQELKKRVYELLVSQSERIRKQKSKEEGLEVSI
ncbi:nucleolar GTP-binding protein 1 isoform X3 [Capsicum annuum]|uniref:nucleolar GTP-binding protein 1 isoform X3 n=1 Tax=Capsicum annuum TaxID=4072 RepID=UPI001FB06BAE|nr:nucleolar GTP-binding protein 1 isoform X3 [Capsicum annuum]